MAIVALVSRFLFVYFTSKQKKKNNLNAALTERERKRLVYNGKICMYINKSFSTNKRALTCIMVLLLSFVCCLRRHGSGSGSRFISFVGVLDVLVVIVVLWLC